MANLENKSKITIIKKVFLISLILVLIISLFGCNSNKNEEVSLSLDEKAVEHKNDDLGYAFSLPSDWEKAATTKWGEAYLSSDNKAGVNTILEVGGWEYMSLDDVEKKLRNILKSEYQEVKLVKTLINKGNNRQDIYQITDKDGKKGMVQTFITHYLPSVRYYLIFNCSNQDFESYHLLFSQIGKSFHITKSEDEIYKLLPDEKTFLEEQTKKLEEQEKNGKNIESPKESPNDQ